MSMPIIECSPNPIDRDQAINNLIESIALMETGLSHIINAEGEKIQKIVNDDSENPATIEDIYKINESVARTINAISKLEMILQGKLEIAKDLDNGDKDKSPCCKGISPHYFCN